MTVHAAAIFDSTDCSSAGCPNEADSLDGLCSFCRRHSATQPRREPPVNVPVKRLPVCRNHPDRPAPNRGKYAYLCAECRDEKRGLAVVPEPAPVEPEPVEAGPLLEAVVAAAPAFELAQEAAAVVKDRMASYGPPEENHGCTAILWDAYLERRRQACERRGETFVLDAQDVCWLNVLQKISREANQRAGDNRLDVMGFAINAEIVVRSVREADA